MVIRYRWCVFGIAGERPIGDLLRLGILIVTFTSGGDFRLDPLAIILAVFELQRVRHEIGTILRLDGEIAPPFVASHGKCIAREMVPAAWRVNFDKVTREHRLNDFNSSPGFRYQYPQKKMEKQIPGDQSQKEPNRPGIAGQPRTNVDFDRSLDERTDAIDRRQRDQTVDVRAAKQAKGNVFLFYGQSQFRVGVVLENEAMLFAGLSLNPALKFDYVLQIPILGFMPDVSILGRIRQTAIHLDGFFIRRSIGAPARRHQDEQKKTEAV